MTTERATLAIYGLTCGGGGALLAERALAREPGVVRAYVNPSTEMAYVEYDPERVSADQLVAAVAHVGLRADAPSRR